MDMQKNGLEAVKFMPGRPNQAIFSFRGLFCDLKMRGKLQEKDFESTCVVSDTKRCSVRWFSCNSPSTAIQAFQKEPKGHSSRPRTPPLAPPRSAVGSRHACPSRS